MVRSRRGDVIGAAAALVATARGGTPVSVPTPDDSRAVAAYRHTMTTNANSTLPDANDPPVLGANPLVGLSRPQIAAALGRLLQHIAVEPGVAAAGALGTTGDLIETVVGRSEVSPGVGDKRFAHPAWSANPVYRRLMQAYLIEAKA